MRMFNINGNLVNVDIRPSRHPIKSQSKSILQGKAGFKLQETFPREPILEDFTVPGSRLSVDFFLPHKKLIIEIDGEQHYQFVPYFHGNRSSSNRFVKQISNDRIKEEWCEMNGFTLVRIRSEDDLNKL